ncbi:hypothetical protein D3C72_2178890 [compost metagenome]
MQQLLGFGAYFLPVVLQRLEFGEAFYRQIGLGRQFGEQVEKDVHRGQKARVITQLPGDFVPYTPTQVDVGN